MDTVTRQPLYIKMHECDNVAIVANDGGLPAGAEFPSGLKLVDKVPQGHKVALVDLEAGAPVQRDDRSRGAGDSRRQLGARAPARDALRALAGRPAEGDDETTHAAA